MSTDEVIEGMATEPQFDLHRITGVLERRVYDRGADHFEDSFTVAAMAARDCLSRSRYRAQDLDIVISASITRFAEGDKLYFEPSFALLLAKELGATKAIHFDVSNACAGMITGVQILDRMIKAGIVRNGMVVSGERITAISETAMREIREPYDLQFASLSVGDSAAAVIMDRAVDDADKIHYVELMTCAEYSELCLGMPSDRSQGVALYTDNRRMHNEERFRLPPAFLGDFLAKQGTTFADEKFDYIVQHQIGAKAVELFNHVNEVVLGVPMPETLTVLERLGNTASTSHFLVLAEHLNSLSGTKKFLLVPAASGVVTGFLSATITSLEV